VTAAPRLAVVIPAFDARETIVACLESLAAEGLAAPGGPAEVIVVDDASGDGTGGLVAGRFPWARLIRLERNVGADGARNLAVAAAGGEVIAFLDADCAVLPGWARAVLAGCGPGSPVVMGRVVPPPSFLQRTLAVLELGEFLGTTPGPIENFATLNVAVHAPLARAHPFDAALRTCGDRALSWDLRRLGVPIRFEPAQAVRHAPPLRARSLLARRRRYVEAFLRLRRRDPTLPGGRLLSVLGPLAGPAVVLARIPRDLGRLLGARAALGVAVAALPAHALALTAFRAVDGVLLTAALVDSPRGTRPERRAGPRSDAPRCRAEA